MQGTRKLDRDTSDRRVHRDHTVRRDRRDRKDRKDRRDHTTHMDHTGHRDHMRRMGHNRILQQGYRFRLRDTVHKTNSHTGSSNSLSCIGYSVGGCCRVEEGSHTLQGNRKGRKGRDRDIRSYRACNKSSFSWMTLEEQQVEEEMGSKCDRVRKGTEL